MTTGRINQVATVQGEVRQDRQRRARSTATYGGRGDLSSRLDPTKDAPKSKEPETDGSFFHTRTGTSLRGQPPRDKSGWYTSLEVTNSKFTRDRVTPGPRAGSSGASQPGGRYIARNSSGRAEAHQAKCPKSQPNTQERQPSNPSQIQPQLLPLHIQQNTLRKVRNN